MYISELKLSNFRVFSSETTVHFNDGINVIIGQNNAGKTAVIKALDLLFNPNSKKKLSINDFNRQIKVEELKTAPPKIEISAKLSKSNGEDDYSDELITVANWLTKIEDPYEAYIKFEFFLPETNVEEYQSLMNEINSTDINQYWKEIEHNFFRKYISKIYVGNPEHKNQIQADEINKFDFQFLTAIRDVERDLFKGNSSLLKEVIDFFMDYDIKSDLTLDKKEKARKIQGLKREFNQESSILIKTLQDRMELGNEEILKYVEKTGAGIDESKPLFDGEILDTELYSALRLIVEKESGIKLPAVSNGLGYNNLIYISLLLSKMQKNASSEYLGSNSKVFSILAIEEPEAHLHPNMQYKFLQFLKENRASNVNQVFITSHSPNITAAVDLDDIIILQKDRSSNIHIAYPGKVFNLKETEDIKSKNYVKRFLDVTKADLFFAESVILVEGVAEQVLLPELAMLLEDEIDLVDNHTSIINIGGRYFDHFLKLFDTSNSSYALRKKVACITDLDPVRKKRETEKARWVKCDPLLLNLQTDIYEYKACSNGLVSKDEYSETAHIEVFNQVIGESSTFEYDIFLKNPSDYLITESLSNIDELRKLILLLDEAKSLTELLDELGSGDFKTEVQELMEKSILLDDPIVRKKLVASRYLSSISKGEAAQELAYAISENKTQITPPEYIKEALEWICQKQ
ncbi:ATP-dependent nuclease [Alkalihalobacillus pseudalcaliphilus]|uniref:ATP-dependent nuclease n=1 Tax=Alkalihalobacillus pseudalcaliphilus TaxID=79884 RepID=UPI00064DDD33|nr:AAA family ATPase [Alkalihalobacillus pseudalcaliphilus]KMK76743.1 chromosome segregation protein SMC [Alkalihalobacillus pseudalcaliphilus]